MDVTDRNGLKVHPELLRISKNPAGGFLEYFWNKPTLGSDVRKLAYAKAFNDWQWVIGYRRIS